MSELLVTITKSGFTFAKGMLETYGNPERVAPVLYRWDTLLFIGADYKVSYSSVTRLLLPQTFIYFKEGAFVAEYDGSYGTPALRLRNSLIRFSKNPQRLIQLRQRKR